MTSIDVGAAPCAAAVNRRRYDGPCETHVRILTLRGSGPIASLFHTAMHPVCRGNRDRRVSADWVGVARRSLEAATGAPALALQGCCGDINPRLRDAETVGAQVAESLASAVRACTPFPAAWELRSARGEVPMRAVAEIAEVEARESAAAATLARASASLAERQLARADRAWAAHCRGLHGRGKDAATVAEFRTAALRIGPVVLAGLPGEVFHEIGQRLIERDARLWPVGFAAGNLGYLYPDAALDEGGYEVDLAYRLYGERQADRGTEAALAAAVALASEGLSR